MATLNDIGYKKVFVSLDGSEQQDKVLSRAIVVAANNGAELYIGHVIDSTVLETAGAFPSDLIPGMDKDAAVTVADLIPTSTQKGPGTVVPDPSANKPANNGPQSDPPMKEVKDERPAR